MGVYIKGVEMPKDCYHCKMLNGADECCLLTEAQHDMYEGEMDQVQAAFCPLVPVRPHGRLIDADALKKNAYPFPCAIGVEYATSVRTINDAPTIIPAEEGA